MLYVMNIHGKLEIRRKLYGGLEQSLLSKFIFIVINFVVFHKDSVVNKIICVQMNIRVDNDKIKKCFQ